MEKHRFVGRTDRWCEVCNRFDRHSIHQVTDHPRDREWAHALKTAVELHFPRSGSAWREWPETPDVDNVCDWMEALIAEVRKEGQGG